MPPVTHPRISPNSPIPPILLLTILARVLPFLRSGWGRSSVGRAPEWHSGGQGFEPPRLHHPSRQYVSLLWTLKPVFAAISPSRTQETGFDLKGSLCRLRPLALESLNLKIVVYGFASLVMPRGLQPVLSTHYSYGRDKMLAMARRTATPDQCRALERAKGA
jgi:hypothetical protein